MRAGSIVRKVSYTLFLFDCESVSTLQTRAVKLRANAILASSLELATQAET